MPDKYPFVIYPPKVSAYLNNEFPEFLPVEQPSLPNLKKIDFSGFLIFCVGTIIIIVLIAIRLKFWGVYFLIGAVSFLGIGSSFRSIKRTTEQNKDRNKKNIVDKQHVECETNKRKDELHKLTVTNQLNSYRIAKIRQELKSYSNGYLLPSIEKKGFSEPFFFKILFRNFGKHITNCMKISDHECNKDYTPDMTFCNSEICIDIEIDEPYIMDSRLPIHCINQSTDTIRNRFITNSNWCVVRFSEEQILLYPYECCKFIATIIYELTGNESFLQKMKHEGGVPSILRWNDEQAVSFANKKIREAIIAKAYNLACNLEVYNENHFEPNSRLLLTCMLINKEDGIIFFANNSSGYTNQIHGDLHDFYDIEIGNTVEILIPEYSFAKELITYDHDENGKLLYLPITKIRKSQQ